MGNYAAVSDIQVFFQSDATWGITFDGTSIPTTTAVGDFIAQAEGRVDGALTSAGYGTIPATGSTDVAMLKSIVVPYVVAVTHIAAWGAGDLPAYVQKWLDDFDEQLDRLRKKELSLVDQSFSGGLKTMYSQVYSDD